MTRVTQERWPHFQHAFCRGSMRVMTVRAVVTYRLVVVHKRPAFLHMAAVAGIVDAIALHELGTGRAMRVVAIGAAHLALWNRMVRGPVDLCALLLMAGETHLGLSAFVAHLVVRVMDFVARGTGYITALVCTALPVRAACILAMAGEADFVLRRCSARQKAARRAFPVAEKHVRRGAPFLRCIAMQMLFTLAVARLAGRCARISLDPVLGLINGENWLRLIFIVASGTDRVPVRGRNCRC